MKTKNKRIITFAASGIVLLGLMTTVHLVTESQSCNLDLLFLGEAHSTDDGKGLDAQYYDYEFDNQADALKNAQEVTKLTVEKGMTL